MCRTQRNTKKVYHQRHAEAKAKAYTRDKFKHKLNHLDYVEDSSVYDQSKGKGKNKNIGIRIQVP